MLIVVGFLGGGKVCTAKTPVDTAPDGVCCISIHLPLEGFYFLEGGKSLVQLAFSQKERIVTGAGPHMSPIIPFGSTADGNARP